MAYRTHYVHTRVIVKYTLQSNLLSKYPEKYTKSVLTKGTYYQYWLPGVCKLGTEGSILASQKYVLIRVLTKQAALSNIWRVT